MHKKFEENSCRSFEYYSIRNKFDFLARQVQGNIDILIISETKLDQISPLGQFLLDGYSVPYRFDRD